MRLLRELSRRKLRSSLTILGITIGIWALVVFSAMANQINGLVGMGTEFYADKIVPIGDHPNLAAYLERLRARPSFARVLQEAEPWFQYFPGGPED